MPRILVVEDESQIAELTRDILEDVGYVVQLARNGREAQAVILQEPPDLILSDVMMMGGSGLALCAWLQAHEPYQHIPFVFMSAVLPGPDRAQYPYQAFIAKPFDVHRLIQTIQKLLPPSPPGEPA